MCRSTAPGISESFKTCCYKIFVTFTQGEKIFYLIKPTATNLALYEEWSSSPNQSEVFFGEKVDKCYKCVVRPGTTLLIPTGEILGFYCNLCSYTEHTFITEPDWSLRAGMFVQ